MEEDGTVTVASTDQGSIDKAIQIIKGITSSPDVGKNYDATVVRIMDFGAFVEIFPGTEGLVHISRMAKERISSPSEIMATGDKIKVKLIEIDRQGRLSFSMNLDDPISSSGSTPRPNR